MAPTAPKGGEILRPVSCACGAHLRRNLIGGPGAATTGFASLGQGPPSKFVYFKFCLQEIKILQVPAARSPSPPRMLRPRHSGRR